MGERKQRAVALSEDAYTTSNTHADTAGVSQAAWVAEAIEQRAAREDFREYVRYVQQPEIATQLSQWRSMVAPMPVYDDGETPAAA